MLNIMEMYMYIAHGIDMQPPHQANLFPQHRTTVHLYLLDIYTRLDGIITSVFR